MLRRLAELFTRIHARWGRTFWILHSVWALATGVVVIWLAHERYGLVPWVGLFLAVTWVSTVFFARLAPRLPASVGMRLGEGFVSYLTRILYQETLFFLIPFYAYSTTLLSPNLLFTAVLVALAVLSCLDLVFDRLLREHPGLALLYFAVVTFATVQFLVPLVSGLHLRWASPLAALSAFVAALPLAYTGRELLRPRRLARLAAVLAAALVAAVALRFLIPPVPLRLERVTFAATIDRGSLDVRGELPARVDADLVGQRLVGVAQVFAPAELPAGIRLRWRRAGELVRTSRDAEIVAHGRGFRVWDGLRAPDGGRLPPGRYALEVVTTGGQLVGRRTIVLE